MCKGTGQALSLSTNFNIQDISRECRMCFTFGQMSLIISMSIEGTQMAAALAAVLLLQQPIINKNIAKAV